MYRIDYQSYNFTIFLVFLKQVSWWLQNYEDILDSVDIYSLIAITSFLNKVIIYLHR